MSGKMLTILTCNMQGYGKNFDEKWGKLIHLKADIELIQECGVKVPPGTYVVDEDKSLDTKKNGVIFYKPFVSTRGTSRNENVSRVIMIQFAIWDKKALDSYESQLSANDKELEEAEKNLTSLELDEEKKKEKISEMTDEVNRLQKKYENATQSLDDLRVRGVVGLSEGEAIVRLAEITHHEKLKLDAEKNLTRSKDNLRELNAVNYPLNRARWNVRYLKALRVDILRHKEECKTAHDKDGNYRGSRCNSAIWTKLLPETFVFSPDPINPDKEYLGSHRRILYGVYTWKLDEKKIVLLIFNIHAPANYLAYQYFQNMVDRFEELLAAHPAADGWICAGDFNVDANKMQEKFTGTTTATKSGLVMSNLIIFASKEVTHLSVPEDEGGNKMTQSELIMLGQDGVGNRLDYMVLRIKGKVNIGNLPPQTVVPSRMWLVSSDHYSVLFEINLEKLFEFIKISNKEDLAMVVES